MSVFFETSFELVGQPVTWAELFGNVTGLLCVWWMTRQVIWNWPVGLVNNVFFFALFADAHLFANAVLQIAFFVLGAHGWWQWARHRGDSTGRRALPVRRTTRVEWAAVAAAIAAVWLLTWWFLVRYSEPTEPIWDSLTLALSLIATWAQTRKLLESWLIYIVVDVISVPLFFSQGLVLTAVLYLVFGGLCVVGLRGWRRSMAMASKGQSIEPLGALP